MKSTALRIIVVALCLALAAGAVYLYRGYRIADIVSDEAAEDEAGRFMTGAYSDYRELTEEEDSLFRDVYSSEEQLRPRSVATQVVAGINYRFVCTDPDDEVFLVTIYKPLPGQGEARVTGIEPMAHSGNK